MRFPPVHELLMTYISKFVLRTAHFANMQDAARTLEGRFYFPDLFGPHPVKMGEVLDDPNSLVSRVQARWVAQLSAVDRHRAAVAKRDTSRTSLAEAAEALTRFRPVGPRRDADPQATPPPPAPPTATSTPMVGFINKTDP